MLQGTLMSSLLIGTVIHIAVSKKNRLLCRIMPGPLICAGDLMTILSHSFAASLAAHL